MNLPSQCASGLQNLLRAGPDAKVVSEVDPADRARGVDEELARSSDVVALDPGAFVEEVVAADYFGVWIGEKSVGIAGFAAQVLRFAGGINADGHGLNT